MNTRRIVAMLTAVGAVAAALTVGATPAIAATAPGNWYYLTNGTTGGNADITFAYGKPDDVVLVGDWNGDATDTLGVRRGNQYYLTNGTTGGNADITFAYGKPDDVVLVGDWNGDATDTLGVRRGATYHLTNGTTGGQADITFTYGWPEDTVLVGDWDGDGIDTLGVRRGQWYYLTNGTTGGEADISFAYGKNDDVVLVGDWDGDGKDTLGVRRGSNYHLTNGTTGGKADVTFAYGKSTDVVLVGDWNGDASDTLGVRRANRPAYRIPAVPAGEAEWAFAVPGEVKPALYKTTSATRECRWRADNPDGSARTSGFGYGVGAPAYALVESEAAQFIHTAECGAWTEATSEPGKLATSFGDGQHRVGIDIATGRYWTIVPYGWEPDSCSLSVDVDLQGTGGGSWTIWQGSYRELDVTDSIATVQSYGCGTWQREL